MFPTPRSVHSSILTEERQNVEFSLTLSVSFPLLPVKPNKGLLCLFRQLVQKSSAKNVALWNYMEKVTRMGMAQILDITLQPDSILL